MIDNQVTCEYCLMMRRSCSVFCRKVDRCLYCWTRRWAVMSFFSKIELAENTESWDLTCSEKSERREKIEERKKAGWNYLLLQENFQWFIVRWSAAEILSISSFIQHQHFCFSSTWSWRISRVSIDAQKIQKLKSLLNRSDTFTFCWALFLHVTSTINNEEREES